MNDFDARHLADLTPYPGCLLECLFVLITTAVILAPLAWW